MNEIIIDAEKENSSFEANEPSHLRWIDKEPMFA